MTKIGQGTTIADVSKHFESEQTDGQTNCHQSSWHKNIKQKVKENLVVDNT